MTKIALITVDYNHHEDTADWLKSKAILDTKNLEILTLVVDNGSDVSVKGTVEAYPDVVWLQTGKNLGFAGGFNRGLTYAKEWGADYFLIINNDTLFADKNFIYKLISVLQSDPKAGIVSPKIYFAKGYEYQKSYKIKDLGKIIWYAGGEFDWSNIRSVHRGIDQVDSGKFNSVEPTGFVSGCCVMIKREILEKVGYFEEKLFAYYEDADWVERIKYFNFQQYYAGNTFIYHKVSRTSGIGSSFSDYLITRNRLWFGLKYASYRTKFALLRESIKLLFLGRLAQKKGILDFITGVWGWKHTTIPQNPEYPIQTSIIAINYKTTALTLQLLKSINIKNAEVIILDNSPEESCAKEVLSAYPHIKLISNQINNGFSAGNNQMINYSLGKYILLVNSDIEFKQDSLQKLLTAVSKFGDRAIYVPKLFFPDSSEQDSVFHLPTAIGAFKEFFLRVKGSYFMYRPSKFESVEGAVMACFLIPHQVINEIGLLQEETFMYFEDIDYCRRAKLSGIPIYYISDSHFIHYHGQASKQAGLDISNQRSITASKWYHGKLNYALVTAVLWVGQKFGRVTAPKSRWKSDNINT